MAMTPQERLRQRVGETVDEDEDDESLFTEAQIVDFLDQGGGDLDKATYHAWVAKAAHLSNLVTTRTGTSWRQMSDLVNNAELQVKRWGRVSGLDPGAGVSSGGRARSSRIVRR